MRINMIFLINVIRSSDWLDVPSHFRAVDGTHTFL